MADNPFVKRFAKLVREWNAEGFAEYMLWRAVEGKPLGIWAFPEIVSVEVMEILHTLRDDLKIWPFWDFDLKAWDTVSVPAWRAHAATMSVGALFTRLQEQP